MSNTPESPPHKAVPAGLRVLTWIVVFFLASLPIFTRSDSEFDTVFKHYANVMTSGGDIYREGSAYAYPPWMAVATTPIAWMPNIPARFFWGIVNMLFLWLAITGAWRLACHSNPTAGISQKRKAAITGAICCAAYFLNCSSHQQYDVVIAGLLMWGLWGLSRRKYVFSGLLLGLAAACKMTPLLFLPYLAYRARWQTALTLVATFIFCNFTPEMIWGLPEDGVPRIAVFANKHLAPLVDPEFVPGTWRSNIIYNQSLGGLCKRWNQTKLERTDGKVVVVPTAPKIRINTTRLLMVGFAILMAAFALFAMWRPGTCNRPLAPEASLVLCGMLLLSPMSGLAHFGILLLPALCLAYETFTRSPCTGLFLVAPVAAGILCNKDLVGNNIYTTVLWYGAATFAATSLFFGSGMLARKSQNSTQDQEFSR